jgi:hypothetical protein
MSAQADLGSGLRGWLDLAEVRDVGLTVGSVMAHSCPGSTPGVAAGQAVTLRKDLVPAVQCLDDLALCPDARRRGNDDGGYAKHGRGAIECRWQPPARGQCGANHRSDGVGH